METDRDESLNLMNDHRLVTKLDERFRQRQCQGTKPGTKPTNENDGLHADVI